MTDLRMKDLLDALCIEIDRQDDKHGAFTTQAGTRLGVSRLAIACLEDEVAEALQEWRGERRKIIAGQVPLATREELLQVAAVAMRAVRDTL